MEYKNVILIIAVISVYYYLVTTAVEYFLEEKCVYPDYKICNQYDSNWNILGNSKSINPEYDPERCAAESKAYDDCMAKNERTRLYAILPIALASMIGGFFIPNKTIAVAISISGLLLLLKTVADNWWKMDEKTKLGLMAATFVILIAVIMYIDKGMKYLKSAI